MKYFRKAGRWKITDSDSFCLMIVAYPSSEESSEKKEKRMLIINFMVIFVIEHLIEIEARYTQLLSFHLNYPTKNEFWSLKHIDIKNGQHNYYNRPWIIELETIEQSNEIKQKKVEAKASLYLV